jgi:hypothetical protein
MQFGLIIPVLCHRAERCIHAAFITWLLPALVLILTIESSQAGSATWDPPSGPSGEFGGLGRPAAVQRFCLLSPKLLPFVQPMTLPYFPFLSATFAIHERFSP